jgi:excisionase family DNA binding protein
VSSGHDRRDRRVRAHGATGTRGGCDPLPPLGLERAQLRDANYIARLLGIPRKTVLQYARDGRLPCVRLGKHVRFVVADVERALEREP